MSDMKLSVSEIKDLMDKMTKTGITTVKVRDGEFSLCLRAEESVFSMDGPTAVFATSHESSTPAAAAAAQRTGNIMKSPLVGTFYAKAAPDKPDFVQVGQAVKKGDVVFIVESMKLMNEIQSDYDGVVQEILVQNGQGVEYGQPVLIIE